MTAGSHNWPTARPTANVAYALTKPAPLWEHERIAAEARAWIAWFVYQIRQDYSRWDRENAEVRL